MASPTAKYPRVLYLIGVFKLFKGLVLFAVAIGIIRLLNKDLSLEVYRWANAFRVDPENHFVQRLLVRLSILDEKKLKELSVGTFFYAGLFLTEGTGLLLRRHWAEYFTMIVTGTFIPLEVYELARRTTVARGVILLLNIAVIIYLAINLRRERRR